MKKIIFNTKKYPFDKIVGNLYNCPLHEINDKKDHTIGDIGKDTDSKFHTVFYDKLSGGWAEFITLYKLFIKNEIAPLFVEENQLIYQKSPSFRISQPGGKAVYVPHCDGDELHKHPSGEINVYMPLTKIFGNNSMYVESLPGLGDYVPVEGDFGNLFLFYGNKLRHFNKFNDTNTTRCSFDFRVIPPVNYNPEYSAESATMNNKFIVGGYYNILTK